MRSILFVAAIALSACSGPPRAGHGVVRTERGTCLDGPHEPMRIAKLPGTAAMSEKPLDPHDEVFVHCGEPRNAAPVSFPEDPRPRAGRDPSKPSAPS